MAQIYFVNVHKGKTEYNSAKKMDASTFKNVFGKPEQKQKHSILEISAAQYKQAQFRDGLDRLSNKENVSQIDMYPTCMMDPDDYYG
jgi:hypothetical protein